jgi:hypothetical protein
MVVHVLYLNLNRKGYGFKQERNRLVLFICSTADASGAILYRQLYFTRLRNTKSGRRRWESTHVTIPPLELH